MKMFLIVASVIPQRQASVGGDFWVQPAPGGDAEKTLGL